MPIAYCDRCWKVNIFPDNIRELGKVWLKFLLESTRIVMWLTLLDLCHLLLRNVHKMSAYNIAAVEAKMACCQSAIISHYDVVVLFLNLTIFCTRSNANDPGLSLGILKVDGIVCDCNNTFHRDNLWLFLSYDLLISIVTNTQEHSSTTSGKKPVISNFCLLVDLDLNIF